VTAVRRPPVSARAGVGASTVRPGTPADLILTADADTAVGLLAGQVRPRDLPAMVLQGGAAARKRLTALVAHAGALTHELLAAP